MTLVKRFAPVLGREVYLRPGTSDSVVFSETFDGLYHVPPDWMPVPSSVLDLGANVGLVAAHYRVLWPDARVVAVEPDPACCDLIKRNAPGVSVLPAAVASFSDVGVLVGSESYAMRFVHYEDLRDEHPVCVDRVHSVDFDNLIGPRKDFVKMDVEGMEWDLLGLSELSRVRYVLVELHDWRQDGLSDEKMILEAGRLFEAQGFEWEPHRVHPRAVFAWRS